MGFLAPRLLRFLWHVPGPLLRLILCGIAAYDVVLAIRGKPAEMVVTAFYQLFP